MKLIRCNGKELIIHEVGEAKVIFRLQASAVPIKTEPWQLVDDETARAILRELLASKLYKVIK